MPHKPTPLEALSEQERARLIEWEQGFLGDFIADDCLRTTLPGERRDWEDDMLRRYSRLTEECHGHFWWAMAGGMDEAQRECLPDSEDDLTNSELDEG